MDLDLTHPALADLKRTAQRRLPHFVWEYLDSATGGEAAVARAEAALDAVTLAPRVLRGTQEADLSVTLFGRTHPLPFGIAPVGMSGLIRPGAEATLARLAAAEDIPYGLSTVAAAAPEEVGPHLGAAGWFQLYPPGDAEIRRDMLRRAKAAGFTGLILTVDVPIASRRERQRRARLTTPMRVTPRVMLDCARRPVWSLRRLHAGIPQLATLAPYAQDAGSRDSTAHVGYLLRTAPDWDYLKALRQDWDGPLMVKGAMVPEDGARCLDLGADALWLSNHGGRQFEGGPAPLHQLAAMRGALGPEPRLIYDGAIRSGLDILRVLATGADFVMLGRAFHHGLAAFGPGGAAHVVHVLRAGLKADMGQLGAARLADLPDHLAPGARAADRAATW